MSLVSKIFLLVGALILTGCLTPTPPKLVIKPKPKIALALGGGAAKGFAHIGVIKVLEQNGIHVDMVTGTSAGSVIGSLYASGLNGYQLQQLAINLDESSVADFTLSSGGFVKGEALQNFINKAVKNRPIEQLKIPFGAVATNRATGEAVVFRQGNTGQAVRASASIPNVFQPVVIGKNSYVDGGLTQPVPVEAAKNMGADIIIAVDISDRPKAGNTSGLLATFDQSINIMSQVALNKQLKMATVVIHPDISHLPSVSFDRRNQAILEGEKAATAAMGKIRQALAR